jgi:transposase
MSRRRKHPLRALTEDERSWLRKIARSKREPASHVARAERLLAVADGQSYTAAARASGRKSGDAVAQLAAHFNRAGMQAVEPPRGGGRKPEYGPRERERILAEVRRTPVPGQGGTAARSLTLSRRVLRDAEAKKSRPSAPTWKGQDLDLPSGLRVKPGRSRPSR